MSMIEKIVKTRLTENIQCKMCKKQREKVQHLFGRMQNVSKQ